MKICKMCNQKTDVWTTVHRNLPFIDNKLYSEMCFTCYFVPKLVEQKYNKEGNIIEEAPLPYSCENLHTAKELFEQGTSDSLKYAKNCVSAVENSCKKCKKNKPKNRPSATWNILK